MCVFNINFCLTVGGDSESHQKGRFCWKYPQARGIVHSESVLTTLVIAHCLNLCFQLDRIRYVLCSYLRNRIQKVSQSMCMQL